MRHVLARSVAVVGALAARDAWADGGPGMTVNPGLLLSGVGAKSPAFGFGGELSVMVFPVGGKVQNHLGLGAFSQLQTYNFTEPRYAFGVQAGSWLGGELGYAYRAGTGSTAGMHGVHAAIFGSLGIVVLSLRTTIPVALEGEDALHPSPGVELAACLALKIPLPIGNVDIIGNLPSGRRLRDVGGPVVAGLVVSDPRRRARAAVKRLGCEERALLARGWAEDGLLEHASVASFLRLAFELHGLGAPQSLVLRALDAAADEVRHTRMCFALASDYAGVALAPGPLPAVVPRPPSARILAREALVDGCIGEGAAALGAARASDMARDPLVAATLDRVARDEAEHARLAWDVLAFATATGGKGDVASGVSLASHNPSTGSWGLEAHGRLAPAVARRLLENTASRALARVA
jgi:hypothetical protein